jgi:uncharacterized protein YqeY
MEFFDILNEKMKEAMKNKNASELKTLRLIKAELMKSEKDGIELNDLTVFKILTKMVNQREESYKQYVKGNREDLAIVEKEEMDIIKTFIPKQPSDEEIINKVNEVVKDYIIIQGNDFKLSMRDMKPILAKVQETYPTANGKLVADVIKQFV